jgi:NAD(P)H-nitrite reductase large subunit
MDARVYRRLFFYQGRLAGAVLVGDIRVRRQLMDYIRSRQVIPEADRQKLLAI